MNSSDIRQQFLRFFESRGHKIVPSAPIVVKNDPTLMFTNAGMNQFKDYFLGNKTAEIKRIANSQKCLRVSGKHNDLEEVGVDTYHHTMFEMLGNWSFGDYFKEEAIGWAWELLTGVYKLDKDRLYVTVFEGSSEDALEFDHESYQFWKLHIAEDRILRGNKKDNFWEMGDTGPCGPCSEIHFDLRPDAERKLVDGSALVNKDHPQVIEIWNLVFMQFNRKSDGTLENLPDKHVDTGMGFERLVRVIHGKTSNYDTDVFMETISEIEKISGKSYHYTEAGPSEVAKTDVAFRVIADHIRAICFAIADGQLPSNNGSGYVIRRILRRAVRYGYSYMGFNKAALYKLVSPLAHKFSDIFPELEAQKSFVEKAIFEEEKAFLSTLSKGLDILHSLFASDNGKVLSGKDVFELYDTFGFPVDLTRLIASEQGFVLDEAAFNAALNDQKNRSRKDAEKTTGDWILTGDDNDPVFVGYDQLETRLRILKYRKVQIKGKTEIQVVLDPTPFYAEGGGQVGDTGNLTGLANGEKIRVVNTFRENNLFVHVVDKLPEQTHQEFMGTVDAERRKNITLNHSATHLLHAALKNVLGAHIAQKGSLVEPERLRFDFSHFSKIEPNELERIGVLVNEKIQNRIPLEEMRDVPVSKALEMGATALFGEKYGDTVRVISFDKAFSMELCGGTHVQNTSEIGRLILTSESAVAAGVRRIEAITGNAAEQFIREQMEKLAQIEGILLNPKDAVSALQQIIKENQELKKQIEVMQNLQTARLKQDLKSEMEASGEVQTLICSLEVSSADQVKDLCFQLKNEHDNLFCVFAYRLNERPFIAVAISDRLCQTKGWNAGKLVREWAAEIEGGGGGQPFFATAGGKKSSGLTKVLELARQFVQ